MATASRMEIRVTFFGDIIYDQLYYTAINPDASGAIFYLQLPAGTSLIGMPSNITGVVIIPPPDNTNIMTLKGNPSDVGFRIHLTDPCFISLSSPPGPLYINTVSPMTKTRFIFK